MRKYDPFYIQFTFRVLSAFAFEDCDELFWREDEGDLRFFVICSDVFDWGTADLEEITPENIDWLEQARRDAVVVTRQRWPIFWPALFCARLRKRVPQEPFMKLVDHPDMKQMFLDAARP